MRKGYLSALMAVLFCFLLTVSAFADNYLETLTQDQKINGFTATTVYENSAGQAMGARFVSDQYGFIVDLMRIESVPQGFFWVKTPVYDDRGEPHACEHLLLGKGNRGRYVATLEDMALGNSTAYTSRLYTAYHFNTSAGEETFYKIFEAKLDAFLNPDFTDEEIRREVCHIGVNEDSETGKLSLEEKGTVYTEMVSSFEKSYYYQYGPLGKLQYGEGHPQVNISGGEPGAMRTMVPQNMWDFHKKAYRLGNMGVIASVPDGVNVETFLARLSEILSRVQKQTEPGVDNSMTVRDLPEPKISTPFGQVVIADYPSENAEDPGSIVYGYPPYLEYDNRTAFVFDLFMSTFANGQTSNLYNLFINSETRAIDLGGNQVWGSADSDQGHPVHFGLEGIKNTYVNQQMIDSVWNMIHAELERVHDFADGSDELAAFNDRAGAQLAQSAKQYDQYMNSPPMFGFRRSSAGGWYANLMFLENEPGFRKSLVQKPYFKYTEELLASGKNVWKGFIDDWKLLTVKPYAVGIKPSPEPLAQNAAAKQERIAGFVEDFNKKYGVTDDQAAIAKYKEDFDANTAAIEALAGKQELPGFIDNPPLTLDDPLKYEVVSLPGNVPLVASTFDNMTLARVGIAMRLDVLPESLLVYASALPSIMTEIGVIKNGEVIPFDEMQDRMRREILGMDASFSTNMNTGRIEVVLRGNGANLDELHNALGWMDAALYSPYLSTDNVPRIMDLIDQSLIGLRNIMKGSEESWVGQPAAAYRYQTNPLYLATSSFLTQTHDIQRVKWRLTDPGSDANRKVLGEFLGKLSAYGDGKQREDFAALFTAVENPAEPASADLQPVVAILTGPALSDDGKAIAKEIVMSLKATLPEIPDANLTGDWTYLCGEIKSDLMMTPGQTIKSMAYALELIRKADNARMFMISSTANREATLDDIRAFAGKLDGTAKSVRYSYPEKEYVLTRAVSRHPGMPHPVYVGLLNPNTRNGVLIFTAHNTDSYDTTETGVLDCLAGQLYSGGGPHGLFMKTWQAGLAYSNGYGYGGQNGNANYYAERCPDVAETMRFVVDVLKNAEDDPTLGEYAVAQVFSQNRAASRYETRGEAIASDLVDGYTPKVVSAFRQAVLKTRHRDGLYDDLKSRMEDVYGQVLVGYGPPLKDSDRGCFFLIGPDMQFDSMERYIESNEGQQKICRLYPRDFWLTL